MKTTLLTMCAVLLSLATLGCGGEEGAETGKACAQSDLIAQCPPASNPALDAQATSICEGSGEGSLVTESGSVTGSCQGSGSCVVLCQFMAPCRCGVASISKEELVCSECTAGCGNGTCDATETPMDCAIDCGARCTPDDERCNGASRQVCSQTGAWETLECTSGTTCASTATNVTACQ